MLVTTDAAGAPAADRRRRWPRVLQTLWLTLILGLIAVALATQWRKLADYDWQPAYPYLIVAVLAALLRRFWGGVHWAFLLPTVSRTPIRRHFAKNLEIYFLTNLAAYLPGSLWYIPWRVKVYREQGISGTHTSVSSAVESLMFVISHGLVGLPILFRVLTSEKVPDLRWFLTILLAGMLAVQPPVLRFLFRLLKRVLGRRIEEPYFEYRQILASLGLTVIKAFLAGVSHFFLLKSLFPELGADAYLFVTGAFALAWTVGFLTPFAPAGLGVREGLLVWLFCFQVPLPVATAAAVATRILFIVEDVGWAGIVLLITRLRKSSEQ